MIRILNYGFRDYKPMLGRFTTLDPIRDSHNWYVYVNNDPINFIDPFGLLPDTPGTGVAPEPGTDLQRQEAIGIALMIGGGLGIFLGGNIPAAGVMATGAFVYTEAKSG